MGWCIYDVNERIMCWELGTGKKKREERGEKREERREKREERREKREERREKSVGRSAWSVLYQIYKKYCNNHKGLKEGTKITKK
jgi:hypothetical protein